MISIYHFITFYVILSVYCGSAIQHTFKSRGHNNIHILNTDSFDGFFGGGLIKAHIIFLKQQVRAFHGRWIWAIYTSVLRKKVTALPWPDKDFVEADTGGDRRGCGSWNAGSTDCPPDYLKQLLQIVHIRLDSP